MRYKRIRCKELRCDAIECNAVQCNQMQSDAIRCNAMIPSPTLLSFVSHIMTTTTAQPHGHGRRAEQERQGQVQTVVHRTDIVSAVIESLAWLAVALQFDAVKDKEVVVAKRPTGSLAVVIASIRCWR